MDISANGAVSAVLAQRQAYTQGQVQISVLKKAMELSAQAALQLLEAIPAPAPVNTSSLGQNIDVTA